MPPSNRSAAARNREKRKLEACLQKALCAEPGVEPSAMPSAEPSARSQAASHESLARLAPPLAQGIIEKLAVLYAKAVLAGHTARKYPAPHGYGDGFSECMCSRCDRAMRLDEAAEEAWAEWKSAATQAAKEAWAESGMRCDAPPAHRRCL